VNSELETPNNYTSLHIIKIIIKQDDCLISGISSFLNKTLNILYSEHADNIVRTNKVILSYSGKNEDFLEAYENVSRDLFTDDNKYINLIMGKDDKKIYALSVPETNMKRLYLKRTSKCIRVYPTIIDQGNEKWMMVCENHSEIENLINEIKKLPKTQLVSHEEIDIPTSIMLLYSNNLSLELYNIFSNLSPKKMEIIRTATSYGYFSSTKKVNLRFIANKVGVSKSYVSRVLRKEEHMMMQALASYLGDPSHHRTGTP